MLRGTRACARKNATACGVDPEPDLDNANVGMSDRICENVQTKKQAVSDEDAACSFLWESLKRR